MAEKRRIPDRPEFAEFKKDMEKAKADLLRKQQEERTKRNSGRS